MYRHNTTVKKWFLYNTCADICIAIDAFAKLHSLYGVETASTQLPL